MSSALRTIQKRILKRMKFERQTQRVEIVNGQPKVVALKKGTGPILGPDSEPVGRHYPRLLPKSDADRQTPRKGAPRGSRRGTHKRPFRQAFYAFS